MFFVSLNFDTVLILDVLPKIHRSAGGVLADFALKSACTLGPGTETIVNVILAGFVRGFDFGDLLVSGRFFVWMEDFLVVS